MAQAGLVVEQRLRDPRVGDRLVHRLPGGGGVPRIDRAHLRQDPVGAQRLGHRLQAPAAAAAHQHHGHAGRVQQLERVDAVEGEPAAGVAEDRAPRAEEGAVQVQVDDA